MVTKINDGTIKISGKIDSNNAKQFEDELIAVFQAHIDIGYREQTAYNQSQR